MKNFMMAFKNGHFKKEYINIKNILKHAGGRVRKPENCKWKNFLKIRKLAVPRSSELNRGQNKFVHND